MKNMSEASPSSPFYGRFANGSRYPDGYQEEESSRMGGVMNSQQYRFSEGAQGLPPTSKMSPRRLSLIAKSAGSNRDRAEAILMH
jgi:hypothetical protein